MGTAYIGNFDGNSILGYQLGLVFGEIGHLGSLGSVTPSTIISGSNTGLNATFGIGVDSKGNIYAANEHAHSVTIFAAGANGNVAPLATIMGPQNGDCTAMGVPYSCCSGPFTGTCVDNTGLNYPSGLTLDSSGNIYVANFIGGSGSGSITVYPALGSSTGTLNESPTATIAGNKTGLCSPSGVKLDPSGAIWVTNYCDSVTKYPALGSSTGTLNESPTATIEGENVQCTGSGSPFACCTGIQSGTCSDNTGLDNPEGLVFYPTNTPTSVYVMNATGNSVEAFPITGNGDISPTQTITMDMNSPVCGVVGSNGDIFVTNFNNASILEIDPTSGTVVGSPYSDENLNGPSGIAIH